ncbi:MAG: tetratricopeptide repeat protein [Pseudotabrizicola sp.]|uniref:tetratricopeptide repeat protein n=1 Tax=Pseudotabrizicola sp. TaxID=2939647 RepID=UPI0027249FA6|nr:tetratricopeptide repeat protein [Pseudotabrizicola sp.]MDO9640726.1 tetratricopeptide repeat protein [Pseudotabrizicola sp.]
MTHALPPRLTALMLAALIFVQPEALAAQTEPETPTEPATQVMEPGDAGAYLAARSAAVQSNFREGARWFARALQSDPDNMQMLEGAILSYIGVGDFANSAGAAARLTELGGRSIGANIALLVRDVQAEDYDAILTLPDSRKIGNLLDDLTRAWAEFGKGRMSETVAAFDTIARTDGLKAFGLYHKALALAAVGDFEGADDILSGRAEGPLVVNRRGIIAHIQILSQLEKFDDALALLERSFGTEPEPELLALRTALQADTPLAFDVVRSAKDGIAEVFFTVAVALNGEAENGYTLLYARAALDLKPDHAEALLLSAGLLEQLRQPELAGDTYALLPAGHPSFHAAEIGRSATLFARDQKDEAVAVLQALSESHPTLLMVQMAYGDALRRVDRFEEAANAYDAAVALVPDPQDRHWGLFYARAVAHERSDQWDKAEADFRRALALNPDQPQVLNYLGYSFVDRGENLDEALGMIERAVAARPDAGYIIDSLAWAYFRLGRYADALPQMERASLLEPVDPVVTDHLGDVYWAVGRQLEARFQWRRALSFDPVEKDAARIRRKLEVGLDAVLVEEGAPSLQAVANGN